MTKKSKVRISILAVIVCMLFGCEKKKSACPEEKMAGTEVIDLTEEAVFPAEEENAVKEEASARNTQQATAEEAERKEQVGIIVHICGAVVRPGVYELTEGSRVYQAVEQAGGFTEEADKDYLNQADILSDGLQLYVPTKEEAKMLPVKENSNGAVNINTASEEMLDALPGIGIGKAKSIVAYRQKNGKFQTIEDIMKVEGIKEGLFAKIKDSITV